MSQHEEVTGASWPPPQFRFRVDLNVNMKNILFQEVSGMDGDVQIVEYRGSTDVHGPKQHTPGITKYGNVTLKRGVFVNDNLFWDWYSQVRMNTIQKATVIIRLLNEHDLITMLWTLNNAWPTKISSIDLKSDGNEVAVESIEFAYEQQTIANGK